MELLMVLVILGLLMGMLLAVLGKVRRQQEMAGCLSNLRQLVSATMMYAADHNGYGPDELAIYTWDALVEPYVRDVRIYACPADAEELCEQFGTSYEIRDFLAVDIDHPERSFLNKRLLEARPASLILLFEPVPGWHQEGALNAGCIDGTARPYRVEEFDQNLMLEVEQ